MCGRLICQTRTDKAALKLNSCFDTAQKIQFKEALLYYERFSRKSKTKT